MKTEVGGRGKRVPVRIAGIGFVVFGLLVGVGSIRLGIGSWHSPGAGFFPLGIGTGMVVLGALLALSRHEETHAQKVYPPMVVGRLAYAVILLAGFTLALERLGFLPTTFLFILLWLRSIEKSSGVEVALMAVASTVAIYAVFVWWLHVPLPAGVLGW